MSAPRAGWLLGVAALAWSGCTFLTRFDPEGQPCDPNDPDPRTNCLTDAGYWCVDHACRKGPPPDADGGTDAGKADGGKSDAGCDGGDGGKFGC